VFHRAGAVVSPDALLALQRAVGNREVVTALASSATSQLRNSAEPLVQRDMWKEEGDALLAATRNAAQIDYATKVVDVDLPLPKLFSSVKQKLDTGQGAAAKAELLAGRVESTDMLPSDTDARNEIIGRSSGAGTSIMALPPDVQTFLVALFHLIEKNHSTTKLNELDLYHGHMFMNDVAKELGIIFHAKELAEEMSGAPFTKANTTVPATPFSNTEPAFLERNFMWVMSTNALWLLGDKDRTSKFSRISEGMSDSTIPSWERYALLKKKNNDSGLSDEEETELYSLFETYGDHKVIGQQMAAGTVKAQALGEELLDVNYFANTQGAPLFFRGGQDAPANPSSYNS
jgi:hypothetical protein